MKRRFFWLVALAGLIWLYLRRGGGRPEPVDGVSAAGDPADQLRRKLDETKEREEEPPSHLVTPEPDVAPEPFVSGPPEPAESPEPGAPPPPADQSAPAVSEELEARRREVHRRARTAADEMRRSSSD